MSMLNLTHHAIVRMSQRGVPVDDVKLVQAIATAVEGGFLVRRKDVQDFERQLKNLLDRARRLEGKRVVIVGDAVITAYHAGKGKQRRLLRSADD